MGKTAPAFLSAGILPSYRKKTTEVSGSGEASSIKKKKNKELDKGDRIYFFEQKSETRRRLGNRAHRNSFQE